MLTLRFSALLSFLIKNEAYSLEKLRTRTRELTIKLMTTLYCDAAEA